ncbi:LOW QUALITY PROTEIN: hypothetical protein OSB04_016743 [Centaurea solstitialis]|uniref:ATP-dependent DNA helicase n=1 Tax=Centaurea solstitialis TaxID=347529 RepID=A0AA38TLK8_9ASTR|nr:LOW QUALITY PROTEIN: hypothetical protein OSB04_016743 [Centaurea solstitialis]
MPYPDDDSVKSSNNRLITEELDYDIANLQNEFRQLLCALTNEQRGVYDDIITTVENNQGAFLWKTLSASIRSRGEIVLNVASSGIASLLLTGGQHTLAFKIPLILNEDSLCYIKPDGDLPRKKSRSSKMKPKGKKVTGDKSKRKKVAGDNQQKKSICVAEKKLIGEIDLGRRRRN